VPTLHRSTPFRPAPSVLVVDDDEEIREVLAISLADAGYHVRQAGSGPEALASLRGVGPADLLLLDLMMPGMDGVQVCEALRRDPELATIPVIICTASGEGQEQSRLAGAAACMGKPFDLGKLLATVARLCRREHPAPPVQLVAASAS
jgi:CheY-like chemotaxis protein